MIIEPEPHPLAWLETADKVILFNYLFHCHWDNSFEPFWHQSSNQYIQKDGTLPDCGTRVHVVRESRPPHQHVKIWRNAIVVPSSLYAEFVEWERTL